MCKEKKMLSPEEKRDAENNKHAAVLSYVWILFLIPLMMKRNSKFCQLHAKQGLVLFIASLVAWFPFFGWIIGIAVLITSLVGILKVLNGEYWKIPYVHEWSEKIKI